jgi:phospholipase/lecithinase/hemolysin
MEIGHTAFMRMTAACAFLSIVLAAPGATAQPSSQSPGDLAALERDWHDCVREAFRHQPMAQSRAASQRSALDMCQAGEDAYVAAAMRADAGATDRGTRRGLTDRARAWVSSMAAEVIDPVSSWFDALRR